MVVARIKPFGEFELDGLSGGCYVGDAIDSLPPGLRRIKNKCRHEVQKRVKRRNCDSGCG